MVNEVINSGLLLVVDSLWVVGIAVGVVVGLGGISYRFMVSTGRDRRDACVAVVYAFGDVHGFGL